MKKIFSIVLVCLSWSSLMFAGQSISEKFQMMMNLFNAVGQHKDDYDFNFDLEGNTSVLDKTGIKEAGEANENNDILNKLNSQEVFNKSSEKFNSTINKMKENAQEQN